MAPIHDDVLSPGLPQRVPFYYGWTIVVVAALAMVATLPGRTHGLGMITERLLADSAFAMDRVQYSNLNLWGTLLGAAFCLPCGRLIDRYGLRIVLTTTVLALAGTVLLMTRLTGVAWLFVAILLTRGFGQSALSVVSITMVGKWFTRRLSMAMGTYSVLLTLGFAAAFVWAGEYAQADWRTVWGSMGLMLLFGMAPLAWLLTRDTPEACGLPGDEREDTITADDARPLDGHTLTEALATPAFWVFGLAVSVYGLISAGTSLFNQSILHERGFEASVYYDVAKLGMLCGLAGQFAAGWLTRHWHIGRLLATAMALLAAALFWLPHITTYRQVVTYAVVMGLSGGAITVVFFTIWGQAYGRAHLGRIQGAAQMLTVLASALGPKLLAECQARTGSYMAMIYTLAGVSAALVVAAWLVSIPSPKSTTALSAPVAPVPQET